MDFFGSLKSRLADVAVREFLRQQVSWRAEPPVAAALGA